MADDADHATALSEREREHALDVHRSEQARLARVAESFKGYDPTVPIDCLECGDPVPLERSERYPHTRRCTACASDLEAQNKWNT